MVGGSGDVSGAASSTDNAIARFNGTGGKTIQNTGVTISDLNLLTLADHADDPPLNVTARSAAPTAPASGDIYLDDGTNTASGNPGWRRYTGSAWEDITAAAPGGGVGSGVIKTLSTGAAAAGSDRNLIIAAESGVADDMIELTGLSVGDRVMLRADTGDTIIVKHNDGGATVKIHLNADTDTVLSEQNAMELVLVATNVLVQPLAAGDIILIQDQQTSGTAGGTFTAGAWQTRVLNTEVLDVGGHASIASNQVTLAAGTYDLWATATTNATNRHQLRLQNITDTATEIIGANADANSQSVLFGQITLAAAKALELQHRCMTTRATDGFGEAHSFGTEIYGQIMFKKVA